MHIIVCIKQVPDPEAPPSAFKVDEAAKKVVLAPGVSMVVSQFDAIAIEAALRIRDALGEAKITLLSLGPEGARDAIKHGLAMGADEGILLVDKAFEGADSYTTALVLAAAIKKLAPYDLILCGRQAVDWDMGQVGSAIAELLDLPSITIAKKVEVVDGNKVRVERVLLDGFETVEAPLPCLVTVSNELGEPRYPQLRQIMMAARKQVPIWTAADLALDPAQLGAARRLELERLYIPVVESRCEFMEGESPQEMAVKLARRLREEKII